MPTQFNLAQTFFVDKGAVELAPTVAITSIDLYFNSKPEEGKSLSGIYKPGVVVCICPVENDQPNIDKVVIGSLSRVEWDNVNVDQNAETSTKFSFTRPILVATDASYAVLIKFDGGDDSFRLWWAREGENYFNTNIIASINSGYNDGSLYMVTNGSVLTKLASTDLKFKVNIAKHTTLDQTYRFKEKKYESVSYFANSLSGNFIVGEYVYKNTANMTGKAIISNSSLEIIGNNATTFNTNFAAGDYIVFTDGTSDNTAIRTVVSVSGASSMIVDELVHFSNSAGVSFLKTAVGTVYYNSKVSDLMILADSNAANASLKFSANDYVKGEDSGAQIKIKELTDFQINRVMSQLNVVQPAFTAAHTTAKFANSTYYTNDSITYELPTAKRVFIDSDAIIGSRSQVVTSSGSLFSGNTTLRGEIGLSTSNKYVSPYIEEPDVDVFVYNYMINNDSTGEEQGTGNAMSKYVSKFVSLGTNQYAEDLQVYVTQYTPPGTSIKVYGKIINPEDYEAGTSKNPKNWTLLEEINPQNYVSSPSNKNDVIEKAYQIPFYPADRQVLTGYGSMSTPNNILSTTNDLTGSVSQGSLVRVYQERVPNNFFISVVSSANSSSITLADTIANTSFNGSMKIDVIANTSKQSAFINPQNRNIVRYYSHTMAPMDTYNQFAIKIVMLSDSVWSVPIVSDLRAVAVSA